MDGVKQRVPVVAKGTSTLIERRGWNHGPGRLVVAQEAAVVGGGRPAGPGGREGEVEAGEGEESEGGGSGPRSEGPQGRKRKHPHPRRHVQVLSSPQGQATVTPWKDLRGGAAAPGDRGQDDRLAA